MNYGYVYRTTCSAGRIYVGQKKGAFDAAYLGSGEALKAAIRKRGRAAFSVELLEIADSKKDLDAAEQRQIADHRARLGDRRLYNIAAGGDGGCTWGTGPHWRLGAKHSAATRAKFRAAWARNKDRKPPTFLGRTHTEATRQKIAATLAALPRSPHSAETRRRISEAMKRRVIAGQAPRKI